ncbi:MAG: phosphocholine cytidylyltransferase family protein [Deltaproteobacteria bacterium]|nr:phosphocholine cytidylyltransferase family protein [Deltaproteobacteria bacterium]
MNHIDPENERVTTALLLAAGVGSRLHPLTQNKPKCLTMVDGVPILGQLVSCLDQHRFKRLVVVTGHFENCIQDFLGTQVGGITIDYVHSPLYATTNNIYSLWMAREIIREPFLLIESDLVFDESLLEDMLCPDRIAIARMQPWMNGSRVTVNRFQEVKAFWIGTARPPDELTYKTVNIYSLSLSSWHRIRERLDQYISAGRVNDYYEAVFAEMVADGSLSLQAVSFDGRPWYEIDTIEDLAAAEAIFLTDRYGTATPVNMVAHVPRLVQGFSPKLRDRDTATFPQSHPGLRPSMQPGLSMEPAPGLRLPAERPGSRDLSDKN